MAIHIDGSGNEQIGSGPSDGLPSLNSRGTIAYDVMGNPMISEAGAGEHPFNTLAFNVKVQTRPEFVSPAWSPDERMLLWWMVENPLEDNKIYNLLRFDLNTRSYTKIYTVKPVGSTQGWYPAPVWSPDGSMLAFQIQDQQSSKNLIIGRADGSLWQVFNLASDPLWSPDSQWVYFIQWQPNSDAFQAARVSILDLSPGSAQTVDLPEGCIPVQWIGK